MFDGNGLTVNAAPTAKCMDTDVASAKSERADVPNLKRDRILHLLLLCLF